MSGDTLTPMPGTLLVFVDETGNEDYSDPKNPTFGRGGFSIMIEEPAGMMVRLRMTSARLWPTRPLPPT